MGKKLCENFNKIYFSEFLTDTEKIAIHVKTKEEHKTK